MATDVETGLGSEFRLDDALGVLTLLGEVVDIPIPTGSAELIDASHMKTTGFLDYIQSPLRDGEEADVVMNWIPNSATDTLLVAARGETRDFEIRVFQDTGVYIFAGSVLVRDYVRQNPMMDKRTGTLRVKWVSTITETWDATP
jgi:hypothetical protein